MHTHFGERPSHVRRFEMVETQSLRRRMEAAIDALIASLDALDGDTDREPESDDEDTHDQEAFDGDFEPALSCTEAINQIWCQGGSDDREADAAEAASW